MNAQQTLGRQWTPRSKADLDAQAARVRANNALGRKLPVATLRELREETLRADLD